jgi:hypothetical protein
MYGDGAVGEILAVALIAPPSAVVIGENEREAV